MSYEFQYLCQFSIFRTTNFNLDIYSFILQRLRQEFQKMLSERVATSQVEEVEPLEGKSTEAHSSYPPMVICSHCQHLADYVKIFMEAGEELTLGEDQVAPLVTEVPLYFSIWSIL